MKDELIFALENAAWPAILIDGSGVVRRANQASRAMFGTTMEENFTHLSAIWSTDNEAKSEFFLGRMESSTARMHRLKYCVKGGSTSIFSTYIAPVNLGGQKYYLFQMFAAAATLAVAAKSEHADTALAHKQKLDCALQLARTMALDFNNALTGILGHTSLLLSSMEPEHPWRSSLIEVEKAAGKAAEIAHDLATFSQQEKETRVLAPGNLNELIRRTLAVYQPTTLAGITWELQLEGNLLAAHFDEAKLHQAMIKLLENAAEAVGGAGRIIVRSRNLSMDEKSRPTGVPLTAGRYVCLEVVDNGCGIDAVLLPRIFDPFFTSKTGHRGLGLTWVYGIVTNHGGTLEVTSELRQGTIIRVYLPAAGSVVKDSCFTKEELRGHQTILMVDDEEMLLRMGQMILSAYGYQVLTASSGHQALEIITQKKQSIDLVITDQVMPNMSGRELIDHLKVLAPGLRILCSSGFVRSGKDKGDEGYLQKPFTSQELLKKVKQTLA